MLKLTLCALFLVSMGTLTIAASSLPVPETIAPAATTEIAALL
jgi:hypothetical protein